MRYQNCIFDLYGTLVDIHTDEDAPQVWEEMAAYYSARGAAYRPGELRSAYSRAVMSAEKGALPLQQDALGAYPEIRVEEIFRQLFRDKGVEAGMADAVQAGRRFRAVSTEYIRLYDGAEELLRELRARGCGVYLLSNAQSIFTAPELDRLGLTPLFDGIFLSSDCGVKKPDRRFFDALLQKCSIQRSGTVMVGNDGVCDILGAQAAGLASFYIRSNLSPQEPAPPADHVLEEMDLRRVLDILLYSEPS